LDAVVLRLQLAVLVVDSARQDPVLVVDSVVLLLHLLLVASVQPLLLLLLAAASVVALVRLDLLVAASV
jgi:hypothetical protein